MCASEAGVGAGDSAVVAVLYEHGEEEDDLLQLLLDNLPPSTAQKSSAKTASIGSVDLRALLESTVPEGYDSAEGEAGLVLEHSPKPCRHKESS